MSRDDLSPAERKQLGRALMAAFNLDHLERLVSYSLDQDLAAITGPGGLEDVTFELVKWTVRYGRLAVLVEAAFVENPGNPELRQFRLEVWEAQDLETGTSVPGRASQESVPVSFAEGRPETDNRDVAGTGLGEAAGTLEQNRRTVLYVVAALFGAGGALALYRWFNDRDLGPMSDIGGLELPTPSPGPAVPSPAVTWPSGTSGGLGYTQDFIPDGNSNRLGLAMQPTHITVHETGNTNPNTGAEVHRNWFHDGAPGASDGPLSLRSVHWIVDDTSAIQLLPHNEVAFHTGSDEANTGSIATAICVGADLDLGLVYRNLVLLLAKLIKEKDLGDFDLSRVVQHNYWEPQACPRMIRAQNVWDDILGAVDRLV